MAKYLVNQYATTNTKRLFAAVTRLIQEVYGKDSLAGEIVQYDDITELHELLQQNVKIRKSIDWVLQEDYHSPGSWILQYDMPEQDAIFHFDFVNLDEYETSTWLEAIFGRGLKDFIRGKRRVYLYTIGHGSMINILHEACMIEDFFPVLYNEHVVDSDCIYEFVDLTGDYILNDSPYGDALCFMGYVHDTVKPDKSGYYVGGEHIDVSFKYVYIPKHFLRGHYKMNKDMLIIEHKLVEKSREEKELIVLSDGALSEGELHQIIRFNTRLTT